MKKFLLVPLCLLLALCCACQSTAAKCERTSFALDTICKISLYDGGDETTLDDCEAFLSDMEGVFDRFDENSELFSVNNSAGMIGVSQDLSVTLNMAQYYWKVSQGMFDVTIAPVMDLYNFSGEEHTIPDDLTLSVLMETIGMDKVMISGQELYKPAGVQIDMGAVAKGYTADKMRTLLKNAGVTSAIINLGGNVSVIGDKNGEPFTVGIQYPFKADGTVIATLNIKNKCVVTSGVYQRCFESDGVLYHHILDAFTGKPAQNDLLSATVVYSNASDADCMSTLCMLLGAKDAWDMINSYDGMEAVFVTSDYSVLYTDGLKDIITIYEDVQE